jgi:DNA mismatch endonuclease Vsr
MSRVRSSGSRIEQVLGKAVWAAGIRYRKQYRGVPGKPDFAIVWARVAIFCDSAFWHGRGWPRAARKIKSNRPFWLSKIRRNMQRDTEVTALLRDVGWVVHRFWDEDILHRTDRCVAAVAKSLEESLNESKRADKDGSG